MSITKTEKRYHIVTTNGSDQTLKYDCDTYPETVELALEQSACWPKHDILVYGMNSLMFVYRNGVKTER